MGGLSRRGFLGGAGPALGAFLSWPGIAWARETARSIHEATRNTLRRAAGARIREFFRDAPQPFKDYPDAPRTALPGPDPTLGLPLARVLREYREASALAPRSLSLPQLTRLLEAANGVTGRAGGTRLRAAPSAGALYAGELYLLAERVEGLPRGLYYYAPLSRELALLREGPQLAEVSRALEEPERARGAAVAVLVTSVFNRYRFRYADRGYRYALIDVGHIGENLRLATASAGLASRSPLRFHDDRLNGLLGIDGLHEAVCALHLLGGAGVEPAGGAPSRRLVRVDETEVSAPEDDLPLRYHAASRLVPGSGAPAVEAPGKEPSPDPEPPALGLSRGDDPTPSVETVIRQRRSARTFVPDPIAGEDLAFVLDAALASASLRRAPVEPYVLVHRASGLAPGLYRAARDARGAPALVPLRSGDFSEALVDACLGQEMGASAAAGIAMVGAIERAARAGGARSYRDLCLDAGALAQRVYLAAESCGIAARNLSAFTDERLNALLELDGATRAVLHLTMLGPGD